MKVSELYEAFDESMIREKINDMVIELNKMLPDIDDEYKKEIKSTIMALMKIRNKIRRK